MKTLRKRLLSLFLSLALLLAVIPLAATPVSAYSLTLENTIVTVKSDANGIKIYSEPSRHATSIGTAYGCSFFSDATTVNDNYDWWRIYYDNKVGWIPRTSGEYRYDQFYGNGSTSMVWSTLPVSFTPAKYGFSFNCSDNENAAFNTGDFLNFKKNYFDQSDNAVFSNAPAASKLAFWFDTREVAYDESLGEKNSVCIDNFTINNGQGADQKNITNSWNNVRRIYSRNGVKTDIVGKTEYDRSGYLCLPTNAYGWVIMDLPVDISFVNNIYMATSWGWNKNMRNKNVTLGPFGYVAGDTPMASPGSYTVLNSDGLKCYFTNTGSNVEVSNGAKGNFNNWRYFDVTQVGDNRFGFYFDTTALPDGHTAYNNGEDAAWTTTEKEKVACWLSFDGSSQISIGKKANSKALLTYTRYYVKDGVTYTAVGNGEGERADRINLPTGAVGYVFIDISEDFPKANRTGYNRITFYSEPYWNKNFDGRGVAFRNLGYISDYLVLDQSDELTVDKTSCAAKTELKITADSKNIQAGTLLACDLNGTPLAVPSRNGKIDLTEEEANVVDEVYQNTKNFILKMPKQDIILTAQAEDTSERPNFASIGVRANKTKQGIRFEYRFNLTHEGNKWYDKFYTTLGGKTVEIEAFGALLCTEKNYKNIGKEGMVAGANTKGLYDVDFSTKIRRVDACAAYEDICLAMVNIPDNQLDTNIYSRGYIVVDGNTYYTDIRYTTFNDANNRVRAKTVA